MNLVTTIGLGDIGLSVGYPVTSGSAWSTVLAPAAGEWHCAMWLWWVTSMMPVNT